MKVFLYSEYSIVGKNDITIFSSMEKYLIYRLLRKTQGTKQM